MEKKIAIYLRLSKEDIDLKINECKEVSDSIANQRKLIFSYLERCPDLCGREINEFYDDGFSGANFNRPQFKIMINLVKSGEINCILVKDFSRFGRNYIEVGDYLDYIFPYLGVRFISVNDNYDSADYLGKTSGIDVAFKNLVDDYYSKDMSKR